MAAKLPEGWSLKKTADLPTYVSELEKSSSRDAFFGGEPCGRVYRKEFREPVTATDGNYTVAHHVYKRWVYRTASGKECVGVYRSMSDAVNGLDWLRQQDAVKRADALGLVEVEA